MIQMKPVFTSLQGTTVPQKRTHRQPDIALLTRTSWTDARTALSQINKGKASGNKSALWLRTKLQVQLFQLGCFIQKNAGKVLFVGLLVFSSFCVGLKSASMQTDVEKLWVEEGGRLEKELRYIRNTLGDGSGSTHQLLIQTPKEQGANVLHPEALMLHLHVLRAASQVTVEMFDVSWRLKDICYSPSIPKFDAHYIEQILENLFPCAIITPLDCFWEGAKLVGPEIPVVIPGLGLSVQWTNLNPGHLVETMKNFRNYVNSFPFAYIEDFMKRAGITSGYQEKPCLDPTDEFCPESAPNKHSQQAPDIGTELTGGCYGFATKYMHWPEDLLVGGAIKNKSGYIVNAEAIQSVVQLMGEREMFEFWKGHYKVHNLGWDEEKAKLILETWQRKFTEEVLLVAKTTNQSKHYNMNAFSTTSLADIVKNFSEISVTRVALGYILMLVYACASLLRWTDAVNSQSGIGLAGVLLVALSVAAGLGLCAILGIVFNASTTQIVPFLALGLGVDGIFLLAHTYAENYHSDIPFEYQTGECLKRSGVNVLITSFSNMCAFFAAAIIPVPALRAFVLQTAILVISNLAAMLLVFPAAVSLDLRRQKAKKIDVFCCFSGDTQVSSICSVEEGRSKLQSSTRLGSTSSLCNLVSSKEIPKRQAVTRALPPDRNHVVTVLAPPPGIEKTQCWTENNNNTECSTENLSTINSTSTKELIQDAQKCWRQKCLDTCVNTQQLCCGWSLTRIATHYYAPFLQKTSVKVLTVILFLVATITSIWGLFRVEDGLDLTDVVPRNTNEHDFLRFQSKYFGFFNMFTVTKGNFEYPTNQKLLYEYHEAFTRVDKIIKNDDGGLPDFWLSLFRDWLISLQKAFDKDWKDGCITQERWFSNATDEGILAYKLLVQTGRVDNPVDKSLVTTSRLVDKEGIINSKAFYNLLSAWVSNDALAYSSSQANLQPEPRDWRHDPQDVDLKIPKSQPLVYAQMPFYLNNMGDTNEITKTIEVIRTLCQKYEERGLPNFPTGIPFVFWEQYIGLRFYLCVALICVLTAIFLVVSVVLVNIWAAFIMIVVLASIVIHLFGLMGILGIRLSAVPAVILIVAVGIGMDFTAHITMGFLTSIGDRNRRMAMTLEHMFAPVVHGSMSTLLGVLMLAFSEFDFIIRYFFYVLVALVFIGAVNGLAVLPVLLSLVGPPGEVIPHDDPDRIATPSPEPSPPRQRTQTSRHFSRRVYPRVNSEISLSTITEEPQSYHSSHEIVVQPEVVVETTTITNTTATSGGNISTTTTTNKRDTSMVNTSTVSDDKQANSRSTSHTASDSGSSSSQSNTMQTAVTTTVTATAKVKVEVHTPLPGSTEREHSYKHRRRSKEGSTSRLSDGDTDSGDSSKT
ncbi:protein patched-like isoform X2 [Tachypleus tridentatus]|uniref:protein patched-like isoform X2 n=1 Tax=Tachypleus tridentatus TaxID=6853 RepID=UPI003FD51EE7